MVGPFEPWAVELMADMSAAAQRPLNWNVLGVNARQPRRRRAASSRPATSPREQGGKVVALTDPDELPGVRSRSASGFVLDAMPGWEDVMGLPLDEKLAFFRRRGRAREARRAVAQATTTRCACSPTGRPQVIHDVVAPENEQYRGRMVGEIAEEQGRDAVGRARDIAVADELNTSFGTVPASETDDDWKARVEVWRDSRARDRRVRRRRAPRPARLVQLRHRAARQGGARARAARRSRRPSTSSPTCPAQLYGLRERGRLEEGWHADVVVLDPETVGSDDVAHAHGPARRRRPALRRGRTASSTSLVNGTPIVRDGELTDDRARHAAALRPRHPHRVTRRRERQV